MTFLQITCPKCGWKSAHPQDIANGYCGNCHEFTGQGPLNPTWVGGDAYDVMVCLRERLASLNMPRILPNERVPEHVRDMLHAGPLASLRRGTVFYGVNAEPIDLPPTQAFAMITETRENEGREVSIEHSTDSGVRVCISTGYLGVDLSGSGPLPLPW